MTQNFFLAGAAALGMLAALMSRAYAGADDYIFEAVQPEITASNVATLAVRLLLVLPLVLFGGLVAFALRRAFVRGAPAANPVSASLRRDQRERLGLLQLCHQIFETVVADARAVGHS